MQGGGHNPRDQTAPQRSYNFSFGESDESSNWVEPTSISKNQFGTWVLTYYRIDKDGDLHASVRPILDREGNTIKDRKPVGQEAIDVVESIVGRDLKRHEEEFALSLKVIQ